MLKLLWQCPDWELDWIRNVLCAETPHELWVDGRYSVVDDRAVIVHNEAKQEVIDAYVARFVEGGHRFGVIHLSDEHYRLPRDHYAQAAFVYRNYHADALGPHVHCFALGYKKGFASGGAAIEPASERKYTWNFVGQLYGKRTRPAMLDAARKVDGGCWHLTRKWNDEQGLSTDEYRAVLASSQFTLAPGGWTNGDSFRLCEALEVGSIPIAEHRNGYFYRLFGEFPFPVVEQWTELPELIGSIARVDELQSRCVRWWTAYKQRIAAQFAAAAAQLG